MYSTLLVLGHKLGSSLWGHITSSVLDRIYFRVYTISRISVKWQFQVEFNFLESRYSYHCLFPCSYFRVREKETQITRRYVQCKNIYDQVCPIKLGNASLKSFLVKHSDGYKNLTELW